MNFTLISQMGDILRTQAQLKLSLRVTVFRTTDSTLTSSPCSSRELAAFPGVVWAFVRPLSNWVISKFACTSDLSFWPYYFTLTDKQSQGESTTPVNGSRCIQSSKKYLLLLLFDKSWRQAGQPRAGNDTWCSVDLIKAILMFIIDGKIITCSG